MEYRFFVSSYHCSFCVCFQQPVKPVYRAKKITILAGCLYVGMFVGEYTCISPIELLKLTVYCTKDDRVLFTDDSNTFHLLSLSLITRSVDASSQQYCGCNCYIKRRVFV